MDRRDFPAVHLRNISKCAISGKCLLVMEIGAFSISLAHTGRIPQREAARGKTPIPSKRLPSLMSGMARAAVSLHGKNPVQRSSRDTQPPGNRNIVFHILVHSTAADDQVWERRSISRRISIPALCSSGTLSFKNSGRYKSGQMGKSPPHRQGGSSGPPAPYQYPAHRSMRRSDRPKVVSLVQPPFLSDLWKARFRPTPPPLPPGRGDGSGEFISPSLVREKA